MRRAAVVSILYASLVSWLTWPLARHLSTHLPFTFGGYCFDSLYSIWALAWESDTLARGSLNLADANIYYPASDALFYGPVAFGALPYFAPTYLLTANPALAGNVLLLGCIVLAATATHLVVRAWTGLDAAGFVATLPLILNRWLLVSFVPLVPHFSVLWYFPLIACLSANRCATWRSNALLLLLAILQGATDVVYVAPAVLVPLAAIGGLRLARTGTRRRGVELLAIVFLAGIVLAALHSRYLAVAAENPALRQQTQWTIDPLKWPLVLPQGLVSGLSPLFIPSGVFLLIIAAAILVGARGWRGSDVEACAARHMLVWIGAGLAMSVPAYIAWDGVLYATPVKALWAVMPFTANIRLPERLRVAALFGVALLCGLAFAELLRQLRLIGGSTRWGSWGLPAVTGLFGLAMYAQFEYGVGQPATDRLSSMPPRSMLYEAPSGSSEVLRALREAGGPTLEVPIDPLEPTKPDYQAPAMYHSIFHRQPLLNGYSSYWPAGFPDLMKVAARLPAADAVSQLRRQTGLAFILVRLTSPFLADFRLLDERRVWDELARRGDRGDLELVARDERFLLFRVNDVGPT
jgi:hypothetical protein